MINQWGGARPKAGRPKDAQKKVRLDCTVLPETLSEITGLANDRLTTLGEVVDSKFNKLKKK